jgi:hypothetical protein
VCARALCVCARSRAHNHKTHFLGVLCAALTAFRS